MRLRRLNGQLVAGGLPSRHQVGDENYQLSMSNYQ